MWNLIISAVNCRQLFVPIARALGVEQLEIELEQLSSTYLTPHIPRMLRRIPGTGAIAHRLIHKYHPEVLKTFLRHDAVLEASLRPALERHRQQWAEHCAAVTLTL